MDSDFDETFSDELTSGDSEDDSLLIEELNQTSIDDWEWEVDNSNFSTSFNYFDDRPLENNVVQPIFMGNNDIFKKVKMHQTGKKLMKIKCMRFSVFYL